eukprot:CAMPEP_0196652198 /NCGR_PEP_ID=MMETSP1086-20130531/1428_1 /TAXON_ID=77921 /ORGANISM="Cyanoptyche  gloeocystis , Strain SAG4.97" /LENGTH=132 /DNA_ID=CAMNT_0041982611 /DNA_START=125 /DNA_END=523 /DNA_ORIENTATION=+
MTKAKKRKKAQDRKRWEEAENQAIEKVNQMQTDDWQTGPATDVTADIGSAEKDESFVPLSSDPTSLNQLSTPSAFKGLSVKKWRKASQLSRKAKQRHNRVTRKAVERAERVASKASKQADTKCKKMALKYLY